MNGDTNPDPAVELLGQRLSSFNGRGWSWSDDANYWDREDWREIATDLLIELDALRAERLSQADQNSLPGITHPHSSRKWLSCER